ncbi:hypothetical protein, partial [Niallia circulans]|uniref:hypothetical protein n=1 Tax=Niallia circulans TaxID=1397 RepID=UPI003523D25F
DFLSALADFLSALADFLSALADFLSALADFLSALADSSSTLADILYLPHLLPFHYNLMDQITTPSLLPIKKRSVHKKDRPQPPLHIILTPTPSTHPFP